MCLILDPILPTKQQVNILFYQLKKRTFNISNVTLPSFKDHRKFVNTNPYRYWFIIENHSIPIGNLYIQYDNSIGLNCEENVSEETISNILIMLLEKVRPLDAIPSVRSSNFFINVSSTNFSLQNKLNNLGFSEIQRSYTLSSTK